MTVSDFSGTVSGEYLIFTWVGDLGAPTIMVDGTPLELVDVTPTMAKVLMTQLSPINPQTFTLDDIVMPLQNPPQTTVYLQLNLALALTVKRGVLIFTWDTVIPLEDRRIFVYDVTRRTEPTAPPAESEGYWLTNLFGGTSTSVSVELASNEFLYNKRWVFYLNGGDSYKGFVVGDSILQSTTLELVKISPAPNDCVTVLLDATFDKNIAKPVIFKIIDLDGNVYGNDIVLDVNNPEIRSIPLVPNTYRFYILGSDTTAGTVDNSASLIQAVFPLKKPVISLDPAFRKNIFNGNNVFKVYFKELDGFNIRFNIITKTAATSTTPKNATFSAITINQDGTTYDEEGNTIAFKVGDAYDVDLPNLPAGSTYKMTATFTTPYIESEPSDYFSPNPNRYFDAPDVDVSLCDASGASISLAATVVPDRAPAGFHFQWSPPANTVFGTNAVTYFIFQVDAQKVYTLMNNLAGVTFAQDNLSASILKDSTGASFVPGTDYNFVVVASSKTSISADDIIAMESNDMPKDRVTATFHGLPTKFTFYNVPGTNTFYYKVDPTFGEYPMDLVAPFDVPETTYLNKVLVNNQGNTFTRVTRDFSLNETTITRQSYNEVVLTGNSASIEYQFVPGTLATVVAEDSTGVIKTSTFARAEKFVYTAPLTRLTVPTITAGYTLPALTYINPSDTTHLFHSSTLNSIDLPITWTNTGTLVWVDISGNNTPQSHQYGSSFTFTIAAPLDTSYEVTGYFIDAQNLISTNTSTQQVKLTKLAASPTISIYKVYDFTALDQDVLFAFVANANHPPDNNAVYYTVEYWVDDGTHTTVTMDMSGNKMYEGVEFYYKVLELPIYYPVEGQANTVLYYIVRNVYQGLVYPSVTDATTPTLEWEVKYELVPPNASNTDVSNFSYETFNNGNYIFARWDENYTPVENRNVSSVELLFHSSAANHTVVLDIAYEDTSAGFDYDDLKSGLTMNQDTMDKLVLFLTNPISVTRKVYYDAPAGVTWETNLTGNSLIELDPTIISSGYSLRLDTEDWQKVYVDIPSYLPLGTDYLAYKLSPNIQIKLTDASDVYASALTNYTALSPHYQYAVTLKNSEVEYFMPKNKLYLVDGSLKSLAFEENDEQKSITVYPKLTPLDASGLAINYTLDMLNFATFIQEPEPSPPSCEATTYFEVVVTEVAGTELFTQRLVGNTYAPNGVTVWKGKRSGNYEVNYKITSCDSYFNPIPMLTDTNSPYYTNNFADSRASEMLTVNVSETIDYGTPFFKFEDDVVKKITFRDGSPVSFAGFSAALLIDGAVIFEQETIDGTTTIITPYEGMLLSTTDLSKLTFEVDHIQSGYYKRTGDAAFNSEFSVVKSETIENGIASFHFSGDQIQPVTFTSNPVTYDDLFEVALFNGSGVEVFRQTNDPEAENPILTPYRGFLLSTSSLTGWTYRVEHVDDSKVTYTKPITVVVPKSQTIETVKNNVSVATDSESTTAGTLVLNHNTVDIEANTANIVCSTDYDIDFFDGAGNVQYTIQVRGEDKVQNGERNGGNETPAFPLTSGTHLWTYTIYHVVDGARGRASYTAMTEGQALVTVSVSLVYTELLNDTILTLTHAADKITDIAVTTHASFNGVLKVLNGSRVIYEITSNGTKTNLSHGWLEDQSYTLGFEIFNVSATKVGFGSCVPLVVTEALGTYAGIDTVYNYNHITDIKFSTNPITYAGYQVTLTQNGTSYVFKYNKDHVLISKDAVNNVTGLDWTYALQRLHTNQNLLAESYEYTGTISVVPFEALVLSKIEGPAYIGLAADIFVPKADLAALQGSLTLTVKVGGVDTIYYYAKDANFTVANNVLKFALNSDFDNGGTLAYTVTLTVPAAKNLPLTAKLLTLTMGTLDTDTTLGHYSPSIIIKTTYRAGTLPETLTLTYVREGYAAVVYESTVPNPNPTPVAKTWAITGLPAGYYTYTIRAHPDVTGDNADAVQTGTFNIANAPRIQPEVSYVLNNGATTLTLTIDPNGADMHPDLVSTENLNSYVAIIATPSVASITQLNEAIKTGTANSDLQVIFTYNFEVYSAIILVGTDIGLRIYSMNSAGVLTEISGTGIAVTDVLTSVP